MIVGVQLYTVRNYCQTLADFADTLARVADMGYTTVQVSGTCDYPADWLSEQLQKNGLRCVLTHIELTEIAEQTDAQAAAHKVFGCPRIGIGYMPPEFRGSLPTVERFCNIVAPAAKRLRTLGMYLMYHNHAFEYERTPDGRTYMEYLSDRFAPEELGFTLDTYWVQYGGFDPAAEIRRLSGRVPCVHFKDMEILPDGERRYAPVGSGILDFDAILAALENSGCEHILVEQDECFDEDPFACLQKSLDYLHSLGLR